MLEDIKIARARSGSCWHKEFVEHGDTAHRHRAECHFLGIYEKTTFRWGVHGLCWGAQSVFFFFFFVATFRLINTSMNRLMILVSNEDCSL